MVTYGLPTTFNIVDSKPEEYILQAGKLFKMFMHLFFIQNQLSLAVLLALVDVLLQQQSWVTSTSESSKVRAYK